MRDIIDIQTRTFKRPTRYQAANTERERCHDIECQEGQTTLHDAPPQPIPPTPNPVFVCFLTEIVPTTEEPRWTTSRLQRLPHNKSAGKQVHCLCFLDPEHKAPKRHARMTLPGQRDERPRHADRRGEKAPCLR